MESDTHEVHIDAPTLNRFADGDLPGRSAATVREHLRSCAVCRREVQIIRALSAAIRAIPAPKPPDDLLDELFPEPRKAATLISLPSAQGKVPAFSPKLMLPTAAGIAVAVVAVALLLTARPDRVMAGVSTLRLEWETPGTLALEYETPSTLAAEPSLRARIRYWVPDSLRFAQTEPGYAVVELSREEPGLFSAAVELPPGTAYAAAAIEDMVGERIDTDFGRFWEYLETDAEGQPTLQARRYQMLATADLSVARAAVVVEEAASQFPEQPEFWVRQLLFAQGAVPPESREAFIEEHHARLVALDRAARAAERGPVELDALHRYAALLDRADLARYWSDQLVDRYPRHGVAALVRLQSVTRSSAGIQQKLDDLDEIWLGSEAPAIAQIGLRLSIELADPAVTKIWLDRHAGVSVFRDLTYDTEIARDLVAVPALQPLAESWILDRLAASREGIGWERPLDQSLGNSQAEGSQRLARLNLYLARLRLARGQISAAIDAAERAVEQAWSPELFVQVAEIHRTVGSNLRAGELLALSMVDPLTRLTGLPDVSRPAGLPEPSEAQLAEARRIMRERFGSALLDEHVSLDAHVRSFTGDQTSLREVVHGMRVLLIQAIRPDFVPDEVLALLDSSSESLAQAGVRIVFVGQQASPASRERAGVESRFLHDTKHQMWQDLGAWRAIQYFVLDPDGRLRHRGEDVEAALRVSLVLSTRELASSDVSVNLEEMDP